MVKICTLRNIITLLAMLFFVACRCGNSTNSGSGEIRSISSEDASADLTPVGQIVDPESGQTIYVVTKNK